MKKLKLNKTGFAGAEVLSRAQLKKVMGGWGSGAPCDSWANAEKSTCYNCCITVHDALWCATKCGF